MAAQSPSELLQWLADNQFLPLPQAEEIRAKLPALADSLALIKELVGRNWLTPFQANQILAERQNILVIGPYRLLERLGEGAMGQVFKAWNVCLGRFAAVKTLHFNHLTNAKAMDRFRQEMATAGHLNHAHIVNVRDAGEFDDRPYMVMDFCDGVNLSQVVKTQGPLPVHLACEYIRQAALGLQHAFEKGVVHRDIKPSNLMLTNAGAEGPGVVKVLDFGLARLQTNSTPSRLTQVGNIIGTIDYIAPEQVENAQKADIRSDIYSLGGTLFFLLAGRPPFTGNTIVEKVSGRLVGEVPQLRQARPGVPATVVAVLERMMALRPANRYQTPAELAQALAPLCTPPGPSIPLAQPVAAASTRASAGSGSRPIARPVAAAAPPAAPAELPPWEAPAFPAVSQAADAEHAQPNPFSFAETPVAGATEGTLSSAPLPTPVLTAVAMDLPAASPSRSRPRSAMEELRQNKQLWLLVGGGVLGLLVIVVLFLAIGSWLGGGSGNQGAHGGGSLRLLPVSPIILKPGGHKFIIVRVERQGFEGPVKIQLQNLPEGVQAPTATVPAGKDRIDVRVGASFAIAEAKSEAQIVAVAGDLQAEQSFSVTVMSNPFEKKRP
jgi:serine/threonine protein kinase